MRRDLLPDWLDRYLGPDATQVSVLLNTAQGSHAERITSVLPESEFWWFAAD